MKERPILFSAPMVRALLDGSKTQTRRIVKNQPLPNHRGKFDFTSFTDDEGIESFWQNGQFWVTKCPYGQPGDRLWVRESFWGCDLPGYGDQPCVVYDDEWIGKEYSPSAERPWARKFGRIPSIHMPRAASRLLLEIVSVRVERLNDCSEVDSIAEGIIPVQKVRTDDPHERQFWRDYRLSGDGTFCVRDPIESYRSLWESINGADSWATNPWVWAIEFKRVAP